MAKLRKKLNTKGFSRNVESETISIGDYLYKSGIGTKSLKKKNNDDDLEFSFFNNDVIHSNNGFENKIVSYNDEHTIYFNSKTVCPTLRLENKYISINSLDEVDFYNKNLVLSTPNIPSFFRHVSNDSDQVAVIRSDSITVEQNSKIYDRMLKPNYVESKILKFKEYEDVTTLKGENNTSSHRKYNTITIDYDLNKNPNKDIFLSFSKRINSRRVVFPDANSTEFNTFNGNIVYLYNSDYTTNQRGIGPYDYLGNIARDYRENINTFINESCIAFNSFTMEPDSTIRQNDNYSSTYNNTIMPIDNFGFPYSSKYKAEDRHLIPASKYITKPFVIEKIKIECLISNKSIVKSTTSTVGNSVIYDYPTPCLNFVNFFLVNQRGNLNTNSLSHTVTNKYYDSSEAVVSTINKNDYDFESSATFTLNSRVNNEVFSTADIFAISNDAPNYVVTGTTSADKRTQNTVSQRDLIGFVSVANYSSGGIQESEFINTVKLREDIDKFIDKSGADLLDEDNISECIYDDLPISIETNIKRYFKNKDMPSFSRFRMYPTKSGYSRSNINVVNNRSMPSENISDTSSSTSLTDGVGKSILIKENYSENCQYVLLPEDKLFLGISLSTSSFTQEDIGNNAQAQDASYQLLSDLSNFGNDLVKISCTEDYPFKLHLIGYYLEDENKKVIVNKDIKNYNRSKKVGYTQNEIVNKIGSNSAILDQNFYDRTGYAYASTDLSSKMKVNSSKNKTKLGNFFRLPKWPFNLSISSNVFPFKGVMSNRNKPSILTEEYYTYKFINENGASDSSVKYIDCFYNKYRFGMFADKLNYNRIHQFTEAKYKNVKKRFMKGFYKQKTPGTVSAKLKFDFSKINEFKGTNYLVSEIMSGTDIKSGAGYQLSFAIRDNLFQEVKLVYSDLIIATSDTHESEYYDAEENIYTCINLTLKDKFNLANGVYSSNEINKAKREFLQKIRNGINEVNLKSQTDNNGLNPKDFKIGVTASIVESSMSTDFPEIKITLNTKGSLNDAKIIFDDINSGVIIEDFALEEGDLLNSYNTSIDALYSDSDMAFKDR